MIWTFSQKTPVKFFQSPTCVIIYVGDMPRNLVKRVVIIRVFPGKTRIGGHRVNFNEMTQNCLNRNGPGQVVKFMRRPFSCSLDLEFYDTRLISTSSHKGIFSLWHQKRPPGNPLCRHPPFPEIPLAYWGPRCR